MNPHQGVQPLIPTKVGASGRPGRAIRMERHALEARASGAIDAFSRGMVSCRLLVLTIAALTSAPAFARTFIVGPDPCPAPADVLVYRIPADAVAEDQNGWSLAGDGAIIIYDAPVRGWASRRLFARFVLDPKGLERAEPRDNERLRNCASLRPLSRNPTRKSGS